MIAGALRRQVWIEQRYFQWVPNFYIVFVGPPGIVSKSTTINVGMNLLRELPDIHFGPKVITWQALLDRLERAKILVNMKPEVVDPMLAEYTPMSCITCAVSELGTFLKPSNTEMIDVMVDLWDGQVGAFEKMTRTSQDNKIENPWINIIGCTTPAWLRENFPEYMIGGGLTSRCIFVYGDQKRQYVAYPSRVVDQAAFDHEAELLIEDLKRIADIRGEYIVTPEAMDWGEVWYEKLWAQRPLHMASDRFSGYVARKQTHIHKLAMILAASQSDELLILPHHLEVADRCVTAIEGDMIKVFESIGVGLGGRQIQEVMHLIRSHGKITGGELLRQVINVMPAKDLDEAVNSLIRANYISCISEDGIPVYRPTSGPAPHPPEAEAPDPPPQETGG